MALAATSVAMGASPKLVQAARVQTLSPVVYDGAYVRIDYPIGDVPQDRGVCTDVVIRAYRSIGIDLQVLVHEDMRDNFRAYPALWGLSRPDRNIDHRRVPNLQKYFERSVQGCPLARPRRITSRATWLRGCYRETCRTSGSCRTGRRPELTGPW